MWDVLSLIFEQLGTTLKWGFIGFIIGIAFIFLLRKGDFLKYNSFWQVVRVSVYYIVYPVGFSCLFWFYSATKQVEADAYQLANASINKTEETLFPLFDRYIAKNMSKYLAYDHIPSNDEIVSDFLNENEQSGWFKTKILHWGLVKSLETIEKKALEKLNISPTKTNLTIEALNKADMSIHKALFDLPFTNMKGLSFNLIINYLKSFYRLYYTIFTGLLVMLLLDIGVTGFVKK